MGPSLQEALGPRRILVKTKTHLVPGEEFTESCALMENIICQHVWSRDYDAMQDRFYTYGAQFALYNHSCYFLIDHGLAESDDVPISWYKWNGDSLISQSRDLSPVILKKLRENYPFSGITSHGSKTRAVEVDDATRRNMIRERLRMKWKLPDKDIRYLKENPEKLQWLLANSEPVLWPRIHSLTGDMET